MPEPYIIGDSSPFLKRVLIPFWVVRIIVMVFAIGVYAFLIWGFSKFDEYDFSDDFEREYGRAKTTLIAVTAVIMVLITICLLLDILCIIKRSRRTLSPRLFLIVNVLQTTLWVILFIMSMAGGTSSGLAIVIMVIVLLSFLGLLIYAAVVFHQFRKGKLSKGNYVPAFNPAVTGAEPQAYGVANTEYSGPYNHEMPQAVPKPAYYGEPQQPTAYGQQQSYGYEPNRASAV